MHAVNDLGLAIEIPPSVTFPSTTRNDEMMLERLRRVIHVLFPSPAPLPRKDPQRSPVPWISDEVWTDWQYWVVDPMPPDFPTVEDFRVIVAGVEDRERAPRASLPSEAPSPPRGTIEEHERHLARTPPSVGIRSPTWPICCDQLTTLVNHQGEGTPLEQIETETGALDHAFLVEDLRQNWNCKTGPELAEAMRRGYGESLKCLREDGVAEGIAVYQCRACGRVYVGGCHP